MKQLLILLLCFIWHTTAAQNIVAAEYFFDTDNGIGTGTALAVTPNSQITQSYSIPTTGLSDGFHSLYIRTQATDGTWSLYDRAALYIASFASGQDIIAAEYFFDIDNGVGTGTALTVTANSQITQSYSIPTTGLSDGFHSLYIRTKATDGTWSLYDREIIYIKDFDTTSNVVSAEYFIDADPGTGNGTAFNITSPTQMINFGTNGLAEGDHLFCIRVQNTNGNWSFFNCEIFSIDSNLSIEDSLYKSVSLFPNPFVNVINIEYSKNLTIEKIVIYDFTGKRVYLSNDNSKILDLGFLSQGVYILELSANQTKANYKIVKK